VTAALRYLTVQLVLQGLPPLLKVEPEVKMAHHYLTVQLALQGLPPLLKVGPEVEVEVEVALRHLVVPQALGRYSSSKVRPEVEAARRYLTVQPLLRGRSPLPKMRSVLQAYWLGLGLEMLRALRGTRRQT